MMDYVRFGKETMAGLTGVMVVAELNAPSPPAAAHNLFPKQKSLQAHLEKSIYRQGVGVLSSDGLKGTGSNPVLFLRASVLAVGPSAYVYGLNLFLMQSVALNPQKATSAITWEHGMVGSVVKNEWVTFQNSLDNLARRFADDFKEVNPTQQEEERGLNH